MLLDTSGLLSVLNVRDAHHYAAVHEFENATVRLTHSYVLAELVPLCNARHVPRRSALAFSRQLCLSDSITLVWVDAVLHDAALTMLAQQLDKSYSLCDAVSFILMQERGLFDALTTDRHFEQAGFRRLLSP